MMTEHSDRFLKDRNVVEINHQREAQTRERLTYSNGK